MNTNTASENQPAQAFDVIIVGGGITGALLAWSFMETGLRCLMLEKNKVGQGSTRLSTALLQYEVDTHMVELAFRYGNYVALQAYAATKRSLQQVEELCATLPEDAGFRIRESLYLASEEEDIVELLDENLYREDRGFENLFVNARELEDRYGIHAHAALLNPYAGQLNATAFTQILLDKLVEDGLVLLEETAAEHILESDGAFSVETSSGTFASRHLVIAAGYEALKYLDIDKLGITINRTYAVQGHCPQLRGAGFDFPMLWETARPYFYARTLNDHGDILIGGGDVPLKDAPNPQDGLEEKQAELTERFHHYLPTLTLENASAWSGVFVESADGLPILSPLNGLTGAYTLVGCGGNGILFALWAARCLGELFTTGQSSQLELLLPAREGRLGKKTAKSE